MSRRKQCARRLALSRRPGPGPSVGPGLGRETGRKCRTRGGKALTLLENAVGIDARGRAPIINGVVFAEEVLEAVAPLAEYVVDEGEPGPGSRNRVDRGFEILQRGSRTLQRLLEIVEERVTGRIGSGQAWAQQQAVCLVLRVQAARAVEEIRCGDAARFGKACGIATGLKCCATGLLQCREVTALGRDLVAQYREKLDLFEAKGWRIDMQRLKQDQERGNVIYAIPSPARRETKGWVLEATPLVAAADPGKVAQLAAG